MKLVFKQVGQLVVGFFLSKSPLAAISGDKFSSAAEMINGQTAVVGTSFALRHGSGVFQRFDIFNGEHGRAFALYITFTGDQRGAESAHDPCDIRTDSLAVRDLLETAQDGIVVESAALYDNMASQFGSVRYLDHLEQSVFNDRISESRRDVRHFRAFFLRLLHL